MFFMEHDLYSDDEIKEILSLKQIAVVGMSNRITSYNVCYTKLLRTIFFAFRQQLHTLLVKVCVRDR